MEECYACLVGVWTGPESHGEFCAMRLIGKPAREPRRHEIRTEEIGARTRWECSCGHSGSVGEWTDVDVAADRHIDFDAGDTRVYSSASLDAPWV